MNREGVIEGLKRIISPVAESLGFELIEVEYHRRSGGRSLVRIFIDKEGGITVDDCERLSREVQAEMDVENLIAESYTLEVSSPGLDRPLKKLEDYRRNPGKLVGLSTTAPINNQRFLIGRISHLDGDSIVLTIEKGEEVKIPFSLISKANLRIEF